MNKYKSDGDSISNLIQMEKISLNKFKFASDGDSKTSECNNCPAASLSQPRGENNLLLTKIWSASQDHTDQHMLLINMMLINSMLIMIIVVYLTQLSKMMLVILLTCNALVICSLDCQWWCWTGPDPYIIHGWMIQKDRKRPRDCSSQLGLVWRIKRSRFLLRWWKNGLRKRLEPI